MKGVTTKDVKDLKTWAQQYNKYESLYSLATVFSKEQEYYAYADILETLRKHIEEVLGDVTQRMNELYENWAGISEARKKFRETHEFNDTSFYEIEDKIQNKDKEVAGECRDIVGIVNEIYVDMCLIPINFMEAFIAEYGIFRIDNCNDIWIK